MSIEQTILSALIFYEPYARKVIPHLKADYFPDEPQKLLFGMINGYVNKYNNLPTKEALFVELSETKMSEQIHASVKQLIQYSCDPNTNLDWLFDRTEAWALERSVYNGIVESMDILDGRNNKKDKHAIPQILQNALSVCFQAKVGHDYFDDAEKQWDYYHNVENKIPFSLEIMNKVTKGGCTRKTLNFVMAGINVGKTTWLINMAESYLSQGLNVLYVTLEVAEEVIRERFDVCAFDMNFDQLRALEKTPYLNRVKSVRDKTKGNFKIVEFASSTVHVGHIRHVINEIKTKFGWVPDVIIVDYMTLMLSSLMPPSAKADSNTYYTSVSEELRGLMKEFNAIGWSAVQFNRTGQNTDDPNMADTGLSIGIQAVSDFTVAFACPEEIGKLKQAIGKVLKNRYANKQSITRFLVGLDNDRQAFNDVEESEQKQVMDDQEQAVLKTTPTKSVSVETDFNSLKPKNLGSSKFANFNFGG